MTDRWIFVVGALAIGLMWRLDGMASAAAFGVLVGALLLLHACADSLGDYLGWAGRRRITGPTPPAMIRGFASVALLVIAGLLVIALFR
jgi:hypothetical protein